MSNGSFALKSVTPILRIFDETKARAFYVDYLGFQIDWEHRFEENLPLYMQISLGTCTLHLSEHHGDCCPGAAVRIEAENLAAFHAELEAKDYKYARPGIEATPWDTRELTVTDPFGNRLIFFEAA
ncbi:glyoxalase superfamily protein [Paenibacillus elgii]|uniref:glyoxalase superfamily protein n=1 Tax=Paenibacillus elgii TaxID=189691 RepID=UPI0020410581|nr:glyoxalase superfamily protein [Paenibacillus elgii]MCM3269118.1 VOC family protein [Paenibacillus elgii]